jgi:hypothetical protein
MGFTEDYMMKINNCSNITVLIGNGEFQEYNTNEIYKIHSIKLPFNSSGKHITVFCKDDPEIVEDREYFDGKILSFKVTEIQYWNI